MCELTYEMRDEDMIAALALKEQLQKVFDAHMVLDVVMRNCADRLDAKGMNMVADTLRERIAELECISSAMRSWYEVLVPQKEEKENENE